MAITSTMDQRKVPIHGDGKTSRDWIWVDDHCDAVDRVLHHGESGEIYNVAGLCERITSNIVATIAEKVAGKTYNDVVEPVADRPGNDRRYAISPGKIMSALGWRPGAPFEERLPELVEWYREHRSWWRHIMDTPHYQSYALQRR